MRHEDEGRAAETATDLFTYLKFMYFFFLFLFEVSIPNTKKKKSLKSGAMFFHRLLKSESEDTFWWHVLGNHPRARLSEH